MKVENQDPQRRNAEYLAQVADAIRDIPTEGQPALNDVFGEGLGAGIKDFLEGMGGARTTRQKAQAAKRFGELLNGTEDKANALGALAYALNERQEQAATERDRSQDMG